MGGRYERDEGLRAVAIMRWLGLEDRMVARERPMPEEQPVTGWVVLVSGVGGVVYGGGTQPGCVGWEGVGFCVDGVHGAFTELLTWKM